MSMVVWGRVKCPYAGPLVFATDGSVAKKTRDREYMTGWGYLSSRGHYAAAYCPQPIGLAGRELSTAAELRAIAHAVRKLMPTERVRVLTDSQRACDFIEQWKTGRTVMPRGYVGSQKHRPRLVVFADLVARYPGNLTVEWVRGHAGHVLNEGADCLARLGCRWLVERLHRPAVDARARFLAEGFVADPRSQIADSTPASLVVRAGEMTPCPFVP